MKEIKLGKTGFVTLVDDEDFEYLNQFKWYVSKKKNNYASRYFKISKCNYSTLLMHREIMDPSNDLQVDHIDHNGLNNVKSNLRICTHLENSFNRNKNKNSPFYIGVRKRPENGKFSASIQINGKKIILGCFKTAKEAALIRDKAAKKYHGIFASLNFNQ